MFLKPVKLLVLRICKGSLFQSVGAADVNDLSPNVFFNFELG